MSFTSVLLPEPDTPQTTVNSPTGNLVSTLLRLFSRAFLTSSHRPSGESLGDGLPTFARPDRYMPVRDVWDLAHSSAVPLKTSLPPFSPASGPSSTIQSAALRAASSCSTSSTVLPPSRRLRRAPMSMSSSAGCSPIVGSSST